MTGAGTPPSVLPAPIPFGNYHLLELINTGGMAEVYKAKSYGVEGFERIVAVKRILPSVAANEEFVRMFVDEAKLAGQLSHSNIAQIFDLGRADGMYYIALEYVPGRDLRSVWKRARALGQRLPIDLVCHIVLKACEGLDYAHAKTDSTGQPLDIVHRDVSPQNILISWEGEVKLIDFGLAKAANSTSETRVGVLKGKLAYMSPEQVRGIALDRRTDVFSLGIVLWELLTGERLFVGESDFETLEKVRKVEVAPPGLYDPAIPPELEDIVLRALQKNPAHRFQSAGEFQYALQKFLFANDLALAQRDLAAQMGDLFAEEITEERRLMEAFQKMRIGSPHIVLENADDLAWGDEESETQVFAKRSPPPRPGAVSGPITTSTSWADADEDEDDDPRSAPSTLVPVRETSEPSAAPPAPVTPPPKRARTGSAPAAVRPPRPSASSPAVAAPAAPPASEPKLPAGRPVMITGASAAVATPAASNDDSGGSRTLWLAIAAAAVLIVVLLLSLSGGEKEGAIEVTLQPADAVARLLVDGDERATGSGTQLLAGLQPGDRSVRVEAEGFEPAERRIAVEAGATRRLALSLEPAAALTWTITTTPPGATVRVGTRERGVTPLTLDDLTVGEAYAVVVTLDGFAPETRTLTWGPDVEPLELTLTALEAPAEEPTPALQPLRIASSPSGASYSVANAAGDVVATGTAPASTEGLPAGDYNVTFTLDGYDEQSTAVSVTEAEPAEVRGRLRATPPPPEERVAAAEPERREATPEPARTSRRETAERETAARAERETPSTRREPAARAEPAPTPEPPAATNEAPGLLSVQSRPAAMVTIDGREVGYTPIMRHSLPPGRYRIALSNPDFGLDRTYRVVIESGRERTIINRPE